MNTPLAVLLIEDREEDALLIEQALRRGGFDPRLTRIETREAMQRSMSDATWSVIISDYSLPHFDGMGAFRVLKDCGLDIPFIIVSGTIGEETAVAAMKAGVHDYIMKGNLSRLPPAIERELRDVADRQARKVAEEQLRLAERLRTIGESTASLIHDLNNPLQAILSLTEILKHGHLTAEEQSEYLDRLTREIEHVIEMRNDVLDYARQRAIPLSTAVDIGEIVRQLVESYAPVYAVSGVTLETSITADRGFSASVLGDPSKIRRILHNLISNAKDAMPNGGRVLVELKCTPSEVVIAVIDNGPGIPRKIQSTLFNPFVSHGKGQGTGLGLALVKRFVEAHGGSVSFTTQPGAGTSFACRFPRCCCAPAQITPVVTSGW